MRGDERGSALLTVLWLTAALAATGLAVANNVRGETERAATNVDDAKAYFAARGAVEDAALHVWWGRDYYIPGNPAMELDFPTAHVHVDMIPETSKLSPNVAKPEELFRLMTALGVAPEHSAEIVEAIADWRKPDPLHQSPFDGFYLTQSPSFLPRHASFQETEELLLVRGITPDIYYGSALDNVHAGLRDCVSVYSGGGSVDINTAQPATLQAIGLAPADVDAIVKLRNQAPILDRNQLSAIQQSVGILGQRLAIGGGGTYTIRATARLRQPDGNLSDLRRTVSAVVRYNSNPQDGPVGYQMVRWFDR